MKKNKLDQEVLEFKKMLAAEGRGENPHVDSDLGIYRYLENANLIKHYLTGRILDWGCGLGQMSYFLKNRGFEVVSYDIDPAGHGFLNQIGQELILGSDPVKLPFADASFDAVVSSGVLEHVVDPRASLQEISRIVKPGGYLFIFRLPNKFSYIEFVSDRLGRGDHPVKYSRTEIKNILNQAGYEIISLRYKGFFPYNLKGFPEKFRSFYYRFGSFWEKIDALFSAMPIINNLSTNIEIVARKKQSREQSVTKRIAKNFSWLLLGNSLNGVLVFAMMVYVARVLGAATFGLYNFAQAFLLYLGLVVDSGLSTLGTREIAREKSEAANISLNILVFRLILAAVIFTFCLGLLFVLSIPVQMKVLFGFTFLLIWQRALNSDWVFSGLEQMEYIPIAKNIMTLITFGLVYFLVKGPTDLVKVPLLSALSGLLVYLTLIWFLFRRLFNKAKLVLTPNKWVGYFKQAIPLGASMLLIMVYCNLDTIMLGFMDKPEVVGYYSAAYKIFLVIVGVFGVWQSAAVPTMTLRIKEDRARAKLFLEKYVRLTTLAFIPLCLIAFLLVPILLTVIFGPSYEPAIPALQIIIWTILPMIIG
ncbi:MAG: oligosaccharide flippase family protein, partial [bacterium]